MFKKLLLALSLWALASSAALAQNTQCADRPAGDSSNACANTRFAMGAVATSASANNHAVAIGKGAGVAGFNSASPGAAGTILTSTGVGSDPTFQNPAALPAIAATTFYYTRTDGNNTACTGLINAAYVSGSYPQNCAFATIQKSADTISNTIVIPAGQAVAVIIGAGTYPECVTISPWVGGGSVEFDGDLVTPSNVNVTCTGVSSASGAFKPTGKMPGRLTIQGFKITTVTHGVSLYANQGAVAFFQAIDFGVAVDGHIATDFNGQAIASGNYTISGSSTFHIHANLNGLVYTSGITVTLTGTPNFTGFYTGVAEGGQAIIVGTTFSGSATGPRFLDHNGGLIEADSLTSLPGSVAGTLDQVSGGIYETTPAIISFGFNGSSSGTTTVQAAATASGTLTLPAATDTLVGKATSDVLTNKTVNCANNTCTVRIADLTGLGTGVASWLATPTLANFGTTFGGNVGFLSIPLGSINFNSANTDTTVTIPTLPNTAYKVNSAQIYNCSAAANSASAGLFSATGGGGTALISTTTLSNTVQGPLTSTSLTQLVGLSTAWASQSTIYFRVVAAQGSAVTCNVTLFINVL